MFQHFLKIIIKNPLIFLTLFTVWLCFEYVALGPYSYVRIGDNLDIFIPRLEFLWNGFSEGGISNWSSLFAGGIDRLANDIVYPNIGGLIFAFFPAWLAYQIILVLCVLMASWFTFLLCEKQLHLKRASGLVGGMIVAYGLMQVDIIPYLLGFGALPMSLYFLERICSRQLMWKTWVMAIGLGLLFSFFSSIPFTLPFTLFVIFAWFLFIRRMTSWKTVAVLIIFTLGAVGPHIPEIMSLLVNAPLSNRGGDYYQAPWWYSLIIISGLIKRHFVALVVILIGLFARATHPILPRLIGLSAVLLLFSPWYQPFATHFGKFFLLVKDFGFDRFFFTLPILLGITVAIVVNQFEGKIILPKHSFSVRSFFLIVLISIIFLGTFSIKWEHVRLWVRQGSFYANTYSPDLKSISKTSLEPFRVATIADQRTGFLPALANMNGFETIDGDINIASKRYVRFFKKMTQHWRIEPKHSFYFLGEASADEKYQLGKDAAEFLNPVLLSMANVRYIFSPFPISLIGFQQVPSTVPHTENEMASKNNLRNRLKQNFYGKRVYIYENKSVFPRVFLANTLEIFPDHNSLLHHLGKTKLETLQRTVFAESSDTTQYQFRKTGEQKATITYYSSDRIDVRVEAQDPTILVLTNNYNPAWHVYADGIEQKIIPANHTFMATVLEKGTKEAFWKYQP